MHFLKKNKTELLNIVPVIIFLLLFKLALFFFTEYLIDSNVAATDIYGNKLLDQLAVRWDSGYQLKIAEEFYSPTDNSLFAFGPVYPMFIKLANLFINNYPVSSIVTSNIFYLFSVLAFYFTARLYFDRNDSLTASLLFGLYPIFTVYSLVAYNLSTFIFFSILSWFFFERKKYLFSGLSASLAVMTRYVGVLIPIIYLLIIFYRSKFNFKKIKISKADLFFIFLPFLFLFLLFTYYFSLTGDFLAILLPEKSAGNLFGGLRYFDKTYNYLFDVENFLLDTTKLLIIALTLFLAFMVKDVKIELSIYSLIIILFYFNASGLSAISVSRYFFDAWPIFLVFGKIKGKLSLGVISLFFIFLSFEVLYFFLTSFFV